MKIAHIQHPYLPGFGYQENHLPAHQKDLGHKVIIFTSTVIPSKFGENFDVDSFSPGEHRYNGVEIRRLQSWFKVETIGDVLLQDLQSELNRFEPDVIHAHGLISPRTIQAWRYARSHNTKIFVDVHIDNGNFSLESAYKQGVFSTFNYTVLPRLSKQVSSYLAVNEYARKFLVEKTTIPRSQINFLPLGVNSDLFSPNSKIGSQVKAELGIPQDEFLILFAGNIEPTKDIEVILKALTKIDADYSLLLLGAIENDYKNDLTTLAQELGINDSILFHDPVPHRKLSKYLNSADVGVWPGKLGITAIEAIGTGLPLIVSDNDAMTYLVSNENGFTFSKSNAKELAERIQQYIINPTLLKSHSQNAVRFAQRELYWENIAEKSIELYDSL